MSDVTIIGYDFPKHIKHLGACFWRPDECKVTHREKPMDGVLSPRRPWPYNGVKQSTKSKQWYIYI